MFFVSVVGLAGLVGWYLLLFAGFLMLNLAVYLVWLHCSDNVSQRNGNPSLRPEIHFNASRGFFLKLRASGSTERKGQIAPFPRLGRILRVRQA